MGAKRHFISNVDPEARTADCAECGPGARIRPRQDTGRLRWVCRRPRQDKAYAVNKRSAARTQLKRRYGVTPEQVAEMLASQGGCCWICTRELGDELRPCLDHCHTSGKIRGVLCSDCNLALGLMADDTDRLARAIAYLQN